MVSLGIMTLHPNQETTYFTEMAKHASTYEVQVFRFHPKDWEPDQNTITGARYISSQNTWEYDLFPLPDFIFDRCFYANQEQFMKNYAIVKQLKKKTTFLGTGLPNKWRVYRTLRANPSLSHYLPKTMPINSGNDVEKWLETDRKMVVKPESGSQGKGILFITRKDKGAYTLQTHVKRSTKSITTQSKLKFKRKMNLLLQKKKWIAQPLLPLTNRHNQPFDLRILMQKNANGKWQESGRGLRVGKSGSLISNIHHGGKAIPYHNWLSKQPKNKQQQIKKQVQEITKVLPTVLENEYGKLFEIGIDIGIDEQGHCWLLEANSKPGHQVVLKTNPDSKKLIYTRPLAYCQYLATTRSKGVI